MEQLLYSLRGLYNRSGDFKVAIKMFFSNLINNVTAAAYFDPLEQFDVIYLPPIIEAGLCSFGLTNVACQLIIFLFLFFCFLSFCLRNPFSVYFNLFMRIMGLVTKLVLDTLKYKNQKYFPFFFFLFLFILLNNILSLIPFTYTVTSSFVVTFFLSTIIFGGVTIIGIERFSVRFANLFYPHNVPFAILHFLIVIEFFSYCMR
jgi:F0F1-type ATP synthase membrane subunit a